MHKVYQKFTDKSNNEEGYKLNQFNNRNNKSAFTLLSFEIADANNALVNGTYNRTSTFHDPYIDPNNTKLGWEFSNGTTEVFFEFNPPYNDNQTPVGTWRFSTNDVLAYNYNGLWINTTTETINNVTFNQVQSGKEHTLENAETHWQPTIGLQHLTPTISTSIVRKGDQHETIGYYKRGEWHFGVNTTNRTGDSQIVDTYEKHPVYDRSDVILYIGDHNVVGTGAIADLQNFDGYSVPTLDQEIPDQLFNDYSTNQTFGALTGGNNFGAEVSFLDYMQRRKKRHTTFLKYGIDQSLLATEWDANTTGNALDNLLGDVDAMVASLWNQYVQPRVRGFIINVGAQDVLANIVPQTEAIINKIRTHFSFYEMPVIVTRTPDDPKGMEQQYMGEVFDHLKIVDTTDLAHDANFSYPVLTSDSQVTLGQRYAKEMLPMLTGQIDLLQYDPRVWFDASLDNANGNKSVVFDQSEYQNHATQNAVAYQPQSGATTINGFNTYSFNNSNLQLTNPFGATGTSISEFLCVCVMVPRSVTKRSYLFVQGGGQRLVCHMPWENGVGYFDFTAISGHRVDTRNAIPVDELLVVVMQHSLALGVQAMRVNGELVHQNFNTTTRTLGTNFYLGGGANFYQEMDLCEIAFFVNKVEFDDVQKIEGYLAHKWGKTLHTNHPYSLHPPVG